MSDKSVALTRAHRLPWRELYDAQAEELLRYLWRLTADREVATELMQDTFVMGMRDEASLREPAKARAWLYRIATRLAIKRLRRRRLVTFLRFSGSEQATEGVPDVERIAVRDALRAISADQAVALVLHYVQGLTRAEIAEVTGRDEETIKSRISRGKRAFVAVYERRGGTR